MVSKVSWQQQLGVQYNSRLQRSLVESEGGSQATPRSVLASEEDFSFSLSMSQSIQAAEDLSKEEITKSLQIDFSISVDATGKLVAKSNQKAAEDELTVEDPWSPENTAKRIVDFVAQAFQLARGPEMDEAAKQRFEEIQRNSVKLGFSQARNLLGKLPENIDNGVSKTFDLVFKGLDKLFHPEDYAEEEEVEEADPSQASFYSSQSFSLSFKVQINAEGQFDKEELNNYVNDAFGKVQNSFKELLGGTESDQQGLLKLLQPQDARRAYGLLYE